MRTRFRNDDDNWGPDGDIICSTDSLRCIQTVLHDKGPVLVRHEFYRGASAPDWKVFDLFEEFEEYLNNLCSAGDRISVWDLFDFWINNSPITSGKCPDDQGMVPEKGAY
jgi:hypothetical protein